MTPDNERDDENLPANNESDEAEQKNTRATPGGGGDGARRTRPSDAALLSALLSYRDEPNNELKRGSLALVLDAAIGFAVHGRVIRFPVLASHSKELVQAVWWRLLRQEQADGQFLKKYDPDLERKRGVYGWVWQNCEKAALDMLRKVNKDTTPGSISVSMSEFDELNEEEGGGQATPHEAYVSETSKNASVLRIKSLAPWLDSVAEEMAGKVMLLETKPGASKRVSLTRTHEEMWINWLALRDPQLNGLTEEELAKIMGSSKATVQRYSKEGFNFMLRHSEFMTQLELMIPNRVRGNGVTDEELRVKLLEALIGKDGRVAFRRLVHDWLAFLA